MFCTKFFIKFIKLFCSVHFCYLLKVIILRRITNFVDKVEVIFYFSCVMGPHWLICAFGILLLLYPRVCLVLLLKIGVFLMIQYTLPIINTLLGDILLCGVFLYLFVDLVCFRYYDSFVHFASS